MDDKSYLFHKDDNNKTYYKDDNDKYMIDMVAQKASKDAFEIVKNIIGENNRIEVILEQLKNNRYKYDLTGLSSNIVEHYKRHFDDVMNENIQNYERLVNKIMTSFKYEEPVEELVEFQYEEPVELQKVNKRFDQLIELKMKEIIDLGELRQGKYAAVRTPDGSILNDDQLMELEFYDYLKNIYNDCDQFDGIMENYQKYAEEWHKLIHLNLIESMRRIGFTQDDKLISANVNADISSIEQMKNEEYGETSRTK